MSSNVTETQNPNNSLPETLNRFLYAYLHALLGAYEGNLGIMAACYSYS